MYICLFVYLFTLFVRYRPEADVSPAARGHLPDVEDDDFDPNYARINTFRDPPPPSHASYPNRMASPHYGPPPGHAYNTPPNNEDPREGLYAKVNKIKQPTPERYGFKTYTRDVNRTEGAPLREGNQQRQAESQLGDHPSTSLLPVCA